MGFKFDDTAAAAVFSEIDRKPDRQSDTQKATQENTQKATQKTTHETTHKNTQQAAQKKRALRRQTNIEAKTKRVNLVIQPSLYEEVSAICYAERQSINGLICELLTKYVKKNRNVIRESNK